MFQKLENASPEEKEDFAVSKMLMNCVLDCSNAVGFEEIVGLEVTKNNLRTAMEQILHYQQLIRLQIITPQSGCLMYGPSGNKYSICFFTTCTGASYILMSSPSCPWEPPKKLFTLQCFCNNTCSLLLQEQEKLCWPWH